MKGWKNFEKTTQTSKKLKVLPFSEGIITLNAQTKNLIVSLTNLDGRVYQTCSAGILGFRHSKKKTATTAEEVVKKITNDAYLRGLKKVHVKVKGFAYSRNPGLRQLGNSSLEVLTLQDRTYLRHGGCRARKPVKK